MKKWNEWSAGDEMSRSDCIQAIGEIAQGLMDGSIKGLAAGYRLEAIRFNMMNLSEREADYKASAATLGKLGGSVKSEAKAKAAKENGKKGGRPRKMNVELKKVAGSSQGKIHDFRGTFNEIHDWVSKWTGVVTDDDYPAYMEATTIDELDDAISDDWRIYEV